MEHTTVFNAVIRIKDMICLFFYSLWLQPQHQSWTKKHTFLQSKVTPLQFLLTGYFSLQIIITATKYQRCYGWKLCTVNVYATSPFSSMTRQR